MQLCEPNNVVQSSLSKPYIEDPIDHQPVYHMESFSSSDCIKGKSDYDLEDQSPSKQQCECKCTCLHMLKIIKEACIILF